MTPLIEIRDLLVQRGGRTALHVDSLDVVRGEVLALVGPNGAGKSTLLLAFARLIAIAGGSVRYDGRLLATWRALEYRRRLSYVFQDPLLLDMSVEQNVALGLRFRGVENREARIRASVWLQQLGIDALAPRRAVELSGGEAQRVSLARALVLDPELLLLDEPFAALDPPTRARLLDDLLPLLRQDGRTTVFVTHDLQEAARLGQRIGVIAGGRLRQVGTASQIKTDPADDEVAAFLSSL
ncbi:MAG TPA: ABC transporter ATP-binding protein [Anaerolineales bacterium]|nr:ABC transporter ATP-binding protein [Anaerolineales bacterium]